MTNTHSSSTSASGRPHDLAICIGRFQGLHNAQLGLLRRALASAPKCLVVLGSAFQARTPRNPFTWQEREQMVRLALPEADQARIEFIPVRDYYDQPRWVASVKEAVAKIHPAHPSVVLVGHLKDSTSAYLRDFPGWTLDDPGAQGDIHSSTLRDAFFGAAADGSVDAALASLVSLAPPATLQFLRAWSSQPAYRELAIEWEKLRAEKARWASAPYPPILVTVDAVIQCGRKVLLVTRGKAPGKGLLAVPGGFLEQDESVYTAALRELEEETGLRQLDGDMASAFKSAHVFDHPQRSQRGRVITHAHHFDLGPRRPPEVRGADDAEAAEWVDIDSLAEMEDRFHDDHFHMLDFFFGVTSGAPQ